jgi:hypothetical protein
MDDFIQLSCLWDEKQRGRPLADLRQASKRIYGGISRHAFKSQSPINN